MWQILNSSPAAVSWAARQVKCTVSGGYEGKCENSPCEGAFNNSDGKQLGFKWRGWVLNIHRNKTASRQRDFHGIAAVWATSDSKKKKAIHYDIGLVRTWHHDKETATAKNDMLKASQPHRQRAQFYTLFASACHWDFEWGVFALQVEPAV